MYVQVWAQVHIVCAKFGLHTNSPSHISSYLKNRKFYNYIGQICNLGKWHYPIAKLGKWHYPIAKVSTIEIIRVIESIIIYNIDLAPEYVVPLAMFECSFKVIKSLQGAQKTIIYCSKLIMRTSP